MVSELGGDLRVSVLRGSVAYDLVRTKGGFSEAVAPSESEALLRLTVLTVGEAAAGGGLEP